MRPLSKPRPEKLMETLTSEFKALELTVVEMTEARLNSQVYIVSRRTHEILYAEVFHKSSCFKNFVGARNLMTCKKILTEFKEGADNNLILPEMIDTKHFFVLLWQANAYSNPRVTLVDYLRETKLSHDDHWNLVFEIFKIVWSFTKKGVYFKHLPFERLILQGKSLIIDAFEFMNFGDDFDLNLEETMNHFLFGRYADVSNFSVIVPEAFMGRKLSAKSCSWVMGNLIFFIFEVESLGEAACAVQDDSRSKATVQGDKNSGAQL